MLIVLGFISCTPQEEPSYNDKVEAKIVGVMLEKYGMDTTYGYSLPNLDAEEFKNKLFFHIEGLDCDVFYLLPAYDPNSSSYLAVVGSENVDNLFVISPMVRSECFYPKREFDTLNPYLQFYHISNYLNNEFDYSNKSEREILEGVDTLLNLMFFAKHNVLPDFKYGLRKINKESDLNAIFESIKEAYPDIEETDEWKRYCDYLLKIANRSGIIVYYESFYGFIVIQLYANKFNKDYPFVFDYKYKTLWQLGIEVDTISVFI